MSSWNVIEASHHEHLTYDLIEEFSSGNILQDDKYLGLACHHLCKLVSFWDWCNIISNKNDEFTSYNWTTFGCLINFIVAISLLICSAILCLRTFSLSRILRATGCPFSEFLANLTLAKVPSPIVLPTSYLPTLLFTCCRRLILLSEITTQQKKKKKKKEIIWSPFLIRKQRKKEP